MSTESVPLLPEVFTNPFPVRLVSLAEFTPAKVGESVVRKFWLRIDEPDADIENPPVTTDEQ